MHKNILVVILLIVISSCAYHSKIRYSKTDVVAKSDQEPKNVSIDTRERYIPPINTEELKDVAIVASINKDIEFIHEKYERKFSINSDAIADYQNDSQVFSGKLDEGRNDVPPKFENSFSKRFWLSFLIVLIILFGALYTAVLTFFFGDLGILSLLGFAVLFPILLYWFQRVNRKTTKTISKKRHWIIALIITGAMLVIMALALLIL